MSRKVGLEYRLLTAEDMARALSVSKGAIYYFASKGLIESLKLGGSLRFRPEELARLFRSGLKK